MFTCFKIWNIYFCKNFYISGQGGQGKIFNYSYWLNAVTSKDTCTTLYEYSCIVSK